MLTRKQEKQLPLGMNVQFFSLAKKEWTEVAVLLFW